MLKEKVTVITGAAGGIGEAIMNGLINLLCLGGGIFLVVIIWKNRMN